MQFLGHTICLFVISLFLLHSICVFSHIACIFVFFAYLHTSFFFCFDFVFLVLCLFLYIYFIFFYHLIKFVKLKVNGFVCVCGFLLYFFMSKWFWKPKYDITHYTCKMYTYYSIHNDKCTKLCKMHKSFDSILMLPNRMHANSLIPWQISYC